MNRSIVVAMLLLTTPALAQQPATEQAMGSKLMREIQEGLQCSINLLTVQQELAKANARIAEFEAQKRDAPTPPPEAK